MEASVPVALGTRPRAARPYTLLHLTHEAGGCEPLEDALRRIQRDVEPHLKHKLWTLGQPTTVISMTSLRKFIPSWATIWQQIQYNKIQECLMFKQAGILTPKFKSVSKGIEPDLSEFGEYVIVKPARGGCGAFVRVMRRNKVRWRPVEVDRVKSGINDALIVQEYIHTGPWPVSYRVGTVFGEPIYALHIKAGRMREPFNDALGLSPKFFEGRTIVASSKGCTMDGNVPEDVIEFARRIHRVFPTIPLLGIDIVREHRTGKLYALEVNSSGWTFHLANEKKERIQNEFGLDLLKQFGGARAIARGIYNRLFWKNQEQEIFSSGFKVEKVERGLEEVLTK